MISKNKIKYIRSLELKKNRNKEGKFVAEGFKVVDDLLALQPADLIVATGEWLRGKHFGAETEVIEVTDEELKKVSFLQHPQQVLAVFRQATSGDYSINTSELSLALDGVQDPGNLGTILRTADALDVPVGLLEGCADPYSQKVVRASMGAVFRTQVITTTWEEARQRCTAAGIPIAVTALDTQAVDIRQADVGTMAAVIGSEGQGVRREILDAADKKLIIPMNPHCESLNAAVAAAIVMWQMKN